MTNAAGHFEWTEAATAQLKARYMQGASMSEIAEGLGLTRNAISGRVHRLGLSRSVPATPEEVFARRIAARTRKLEQRREERKSTFFANVEQLARAPKPANGRQYNNLAQRMSKKRPWEAIAEGAGEPEIAAAERVPLLKLATTGCRWPVGDPSECDFGFCPDEQLTGHSYCARHCRMAYQSPQRRSA